jgi:GTPase involved in cell partitioning and DNA repair
MKGELLKDINLLIQYVGIMRDTDDMEELDKYYTRVRTKLKAVYKAKVDSLKKEKKQKKKKAPDAETQEN